MTYSTEGLNITRAIFRDHPEVWFWQPYNLQLVSKQTANLALVLQQVNIMVFVTTISKLIRFRPAADVTNWTLHDYVRKVLFNPYSA